MTLHTLAHTTTFAALFCCTAAQIGCKTENEPSSLTSAYTFYRDFEGERRVLRIEPSVEQPAECMQSPLPVGDDAPWNEAQLSPELHRSLIELLFDESRVSSYQADTAASSSTELLVCRESPEAPEFCFIPQVVVTGRGSPWRFGLHPDLALSDQGKELIDAFLLAHDACWSSGTPMDGND